MVLGKHCLVYLFILVVSASAKRFEKTKRQNHATTAAANDTSADFDCEVIVGGMQRSVPALAWSKRPGGKQAFCRCPDNWFIDGSKPVCHDAFVKNQYYFKADDFRGQNCYCRPKIGPPPETCRASTSNFMGYITLGISYHLFETLQQSLGIRPNSGSEAGIGVVKGTTHNGALGHALGKGPQQVGTNYQAIYDELGEEVPSGVKSELLQAFFNVYSGPGNLRQGEVGEGKDISGMLLMEIKVCGLTDMDQLFHCPVTGNPWIPAGTELGISTNGFETVDLTNGMFRAASHKKTVSERVADFRSTEEGEEAFPLPTLDFAQKEQEEFNEQILDKLKDEVTAQVMHIVEGVLSSPNVCVFQRRIVQDGVDGSNELFGSLLHRETCPQAVGKASFVNPDAYTDLLHAHAARVCQKIRNR